MRRVTDKILVLFFVLRGLLFRYGWLRSWWTGKPVDASGAPLPWITYPAIDFISQFDFSDAAVFEWGSGFSTLWWAKRCRSITSIESGAEWAACLKRLLPDTVDFIVTQFNVDAEVEALRLRQDVRHDILVIDNHGPFRWRCAEVAADNVADGGMILLDNSDQCRRACEVLRRRGFMQIDFSGFAPGNGYAQSTSIFFRSPLKFPMLGGHRPHLSPAQPNPPWQDC